MAPSQVGYIAGQAEAAFAVVEDAFLDGDTDGNRDQLSLSQTAIASPSLRLSALRR